MNAHALSMSKGPGGLFATLQVAALSADGTLALPETTTSLIIEIGCSNMGTVDEEEWFERAPNSTLIAFEPLLDKYAELLARGNLRFHNGSRDNAVPLGQHHTRGIVLPFAVSERGGLQRMQVRKAAGCSSLLPCAVRNRTKSIESIHDSAVFSLTLIPACAGLHRPRSSTIGAGKRSSLTARPCSKSARWRRSRRTSLLRCCRRRCRSAS